MRPYHLMEKFGVEIEYAIVDRETCEVLPIADELFAKLTGGPSGEFQDGEVSWSNELVNHVLELKTHVPVSSPAGVERAFHRSALFIDDTLAEFGAMLLPGAMHPFMRAETQTQIWEHEYAHVYHTYHRIYNCLRQGWANVQSAHLNISFQTDEEFDQLHAAVRVLLPLIPALAASSPIVEGRVTGFKDTRLDFYGRTQACTPTIAGQVIPEPVFSEAEYEREIFSRIGDEIAPHDPDGVLNKYFLNHRGAIARFDRGSVEIRLVDAQECPRADVAILSLLIHTLRWMIASCDLERLKAWRTDDLVELYVGMVRDGSACVLHNAEYLSVFGIEADAMKARDVWVAIMNTCGQKEHRDFYHVYQKSGSLADRMLSSLPSAPTRGDLQALCQNLHKGLISNTLFTPKQTRPLQNPRSLLSRAPTDHPQRT